VAEQPALGRATDCPCTAPETQEIYRATADRTAQLIAEQGRLLQEVARAALSADRHILSEVPGTLWPLVVVRSCVSAGGNWHQALWPAVALEVAMTAADVFDEVTDGDNGDAIARFGSGVVLTTAIGLLTLAGSTVLRAVEDGCDALVCLRLGKLIGDGIAAAAEGQARSVAQNMPVTDVADAYELAAGKSGPLGELAARLGATVATSDPAVLDLYGSFGWHLGVCGQLVNDAQDVLPRGSMKKQDVRDGCPTVPLVFTQSQGAPRGLDAATLIAWEEAERRRIADEGGVLVTEVLAIADQLRAEQALDALDALGHATWGLRELVVRSDHSVC